LEVVLHRAVARESSVAEPLFTKGDLVAIAREIGISEATIEAAYEEHMASGPRRRRRPHGSQISLVSEPGRFEVQLPARGLRRSQLPSVLFAAAWIAFLFLWTGAAVSHGAALAAAFSTPFWLVGATVLTSAARDARQRVRLTLNADGTGRLHRQFEAPIDLDVASLRVRTRRAKRGRRAGHLEVEHGTKTFRLLDGWSGAERRWVAREMRRWLRTQPRSLT
jgi:hypothetical protein